MSDSLRGRAAVITGAGSGIGEGLARVAARRGMPVVLADIAVDRIERVAGDIAATGGTALAVRTDVTRIADLEALADAAYGAFGDVALVVNNAGIESIGYSWELPDAVWDATIDINVRGVVHGSRIFARRMIAAGREAFISNVASIGGLGMMPTQAPYTMTKHAVLSFSECLFLEMQLAGQPIHVSAVLPAQVATRIFEDAPTAAGSAMVDRQHAIMRHMLSETGLSPEEAAERILDGIASGAFWVSTHPDSMAHMAAARARHLAALTEPALAEEARVLVEG